MTLPTEAEWEKAARGSNGLKYPWGIDWDSGRLHCSQKSYGDAGGTAVVGSYPQGVSPYGILDMSGNIWEWCSDWYNKFRYNNRAERGAAMGFAYTSAESDRVVRGGSWADYTDSLFRCSNRNHNKPDEWVNKIGFRFVVHTMPIDLPDDKEHGERVSESTKYVGQTVGPQPALLDTGTLLDHMRVPQWQGLFVLGCFDTRVTLYSQQVRALNLVYALLSTGELTSGKRIAVIGAGAGGLTAAAAAACHGCEVTLLDRSSKFMAALRENNSRWLHPHISEWPVEGSEQGQADLPLLDWTAGTAHEVVTRIEAAWNNLSFVKKVTYVHDVRDLRISKGTNWPIHATWNAPGYQPDDFDVVVLAVGFGTERDLEKVPFQSYWFNTDFGQIDPRHSPKRYLVTGTGDGGLIDLLQIRLQDFRHVSIVKELLSGVELNPVKAELQRIEAEARHFVRTNPSAEVSDLYVKYRALPVPPTVRDHFNKRLRPYTSAVLNDRKPYPFGLNSSVLNRFLVSLLEVPFIDGEFTVDRENDGYTVKFARIGSRKETFHQIVVRRGPESELERSFPDIYGQCDPLKAYARLDQTRIPIWDEGFYKSK